MENAQTRASARHQNFLVLYPATTNLIPNSRQNVFNTDQAVNETAGVAEKPKQTSTAAASN